jgi:4-alpha-glucanotransferase
MRKYLLILLLACGTQFSYGQCSTKVMEAFGGTSSIAIYNTYVAIGAIADGYVAKTYDSERVKSLMTEQTTMLQHAMDYIDAAVSEESTSLNESDLTYLADMKTCMEFLKDEAQGLHDYAAFGTDEANTAYDTNRNMAWSSIVYLLGLE